MRKIVATLGIAALVLVLAFALWVWTRPERGTTGQVSTNFRWLGPNDRIAVIGDAAWHRWITTAGRPLFRAPMKFFRSADEAIGWLEARHTG